MINRKINLTILTGIRPTDSKLHIGHYALFNKIAEKIFHYHANNPIDTILVYIFIADYHAIIQFSDERKREVLENVGRYSESIRREAKTLLRKILVEVYNIPVDKVIIYSTIQSVLKNQILPLRQLIENFVSYSEIHSIGAIKEAREKYGKSKNTSVYVPQSFYNYPLLQIADVMVHNPDIVIVGKDQEGNLKLYKDVYNKIQKYVPSKYFNSLNIYTPYEKNRITLKSLKVPNFVYLEELIPGTDGRKMSKSCGNVLDINTNEEEFIKNFLKYPTDGHRLNEKGDYTKCLAFKVFNLMPIQRAYKSEIKKYCNTVGSKCKVCKEQMAKMIYRIKK